jgi:pseudouridine-5'-phosphate glycosidase
LPGFFVRETGLRLAARADSPAEVAAIYRAQRALGLPQALLVAVPPPAEAAVPADRAAALLDEALQAMDARAVHGSDVTPFLLGDLVERSGGATLRANVALLLNNARVGAAIARALRVAP